MYRTVERVGTPTVWVLILLGAAGAARYFLPAPPLLVAPNLYLLSQHRFLFLGHIGAGLIAALAGLIQFNATLRQRRPDVHRAFGKLYVLAVLFSGIVAFILGPYLFRAFALPARISGLPPIFAGSGFTTRGFIPAFLAFETLAVVWLAITTTAYVRARRRRYTEHRAWMVRSYSLTFGFVSVRLASLPLLWITHNVELASTLAIWSWTVNLLVAEWILRAGARRAASPQVQPVAAGD